MKLFWITFRNKDTIDVPPLICDRNNEGASPEESTGQNNNLHTSLYIQ